MPALLPDLLARLFAPWTRPRSGPSTTHLEAGDISHTLSSMLPDASRRFTRWRSRASINRHHFLRAQAPVRLRFRARERVGGYCNYYTITYKICSAPRRSPCARTRGLGGPAHPVLGSVLSGACLPLPVDRALALRYTSDITKKVVI